MLAVSCKPQVPDDVIKPDDMEDILVDYHLARALAFQDDGSYDDRGYLQHLYLEAVYKKHGVTEAEFDSSMVYYYSRADVLAKMYKRVSERIDKQALAMGASESEIARYSSLNANGDTANIWADHFSAMLTPLPPYNLLKFEIEVDTAFRQGDTFLLQFVSDFFYQSGAKNATALLSMTYEGDTVVTRSTRFSSSGVNQLRAEGLKDLSLKRLRGFFYLHNEDKHTTVQRLLFLNNIQLIRFHQPNAKKEKPVVDAPDSIAVADSARRAGFTPASSGDSTRESRMLLSPD